MLPPGLPTSIRIGEGPGSTPVKEQSCAARFVNAGLAGLTAGTFVGTAEWLWQYSPQSAAVAAGGARRVAEGGYSLIQRRAVVFSVAGVAFASTECGVNTVLGDPYAPEGTIAGSVVVGGLLGVLRQSPIAGVGAALALSIGLVTFDYNGGRIFSISDEAWSRTGLRNEQH
jgi:hypothetical protein